MDVVLLDVSISQLASSFVGSVERDLMRQVHGTPDPLGMSHLAAVPPEELLSQKDDSKGRLHLSFSYGNRFDPSL